MAPRTVIMALLCPLPPAHPELLTFKNRRRTEILRSQQCVLQDLTAPHALPALSSLRIASESWPLVPLAGFEPAMNAVLSSERLPFPPQGQYFTFQAGMTATLYSPRSFKFWPLHIAAQGPEFHAAKSSRSCSASAGLSR